MRKYAALVALSFVLAACSGERPSDPHEDRTDSRSHPSPSSAVPNLRGNVAMQVGQTAKLIGSASDSEPYPVEFVVTSIEPDFQCTGPDAKPSVSGHHLAVRITIKTGPNMNAVTGGLRLHIRSTDFVVLGQESQQQVNIDPSYYVDMCVPAREGSPNGGIVEGVTASMTIVLDTKATSGYVVFRPLFRNYEEGFEYRF